MNMTQGTREIRQYNKSGEMFACDLSSMTMSAMLHHSEQDTDLDDYNLDNVMTQEDVDNSRQVR